MEAYRSNRPVRLVAAVVSFLYAAAWVLTAFLLIAIPSVEVLADPSPRDFDFALGVPAVADFGDLRLPATWAGERGSVALKATEVTLRVPLFLAPASFRIASYAGFLVLCAMSLAFLHQLRALFRSARDGAPFDSRNAGRLRWMGLLVVAWHVFTRAFGAWQAPRVLGTIADQSIRLDLPMALDERMLFSFNESVLLVALMLIALAEVFKRGAALEHEQSLVV